MSLHGTMEINFSVLVVEIDRERIRVTSVTDDGKEAPVGGMQDPVAIFPGKFLLEPAHRPEGGIVIHVASF